MVQGKTSFFQFVGNKSAGDSYKEFKSTGKATLGGTLSKDMYSQLKEIKKIPGASNHVDLTSPALVQGTARGIISTAEKYFPGSERYVKSGVIGLFLINNSSKRVKQALNAKKSTAEALTCGNLGGAVQTATAYAGHGALWATASSIVATDLAVGTHGPLGFTTGTMLIVGGSPLVNAASKAGGDLTQNACHKVFEKINATEKPTSHSVSPSSLSTISIRRF